MHPFLGPKSLLAVISLCAFKAFAQNPAATPLTSEQIIAKSSPSVALVLAGKPPSELAGVGSAVVVRENGILLTAHHVIQDAQAVQVRFKNGETFDDVQLLGVDRRRDVAAIRISAAGLPALQPAPASQAKAGDPVWVVSSAAALPWTASTGIISSYRLAEELPGAGSGYRVLQFTAPVSAGSSGGVLLDAQGRALGLILGSLAGGQNLNFAVPVENVLGLAEAAVSRTFASGAALQLPSEQKAAQGPVVVQSEVAPSAPRDLPEEDFARSEILKSKDKEFILRNFRTMFVDTQKAQFFGPRQMQAALGRNKDFVNLGISLVDARGLADVVLEVGYTFAWDFPFALRHQTTSMILLSGKGVGAFSGPAGAASVAKQLTKLLKPYRSTPPTPKASSKK